MQHLGKGMKCSAIFLTLVLLASYSTRLAQSQDQQPQGPPPSYSPQQPPEQPNGPPPSYAPEQLDRLVSRIALYPDPLLAQVLAAATFPDENPEAARQADEHHYRRGP